MLVVNACVQDPANKTKTNIIPVKVYVVRTEKVFYPIHTSGMLKSESEIKLSFKTGGLIETVFVNEGQLVKKDQVLAKLDLSEINANVTLAASALDKARRDFSRIENLYNDSVASLEMYQNAKTALDVATSNYNIASFNKQHSVIKAPSNGKILAVLYEENEIIAPGHPVFLFASTGKNWITNTSVNDIDIVKLSVGDSANIQFDAFPGKRFKATVIEISRMADPYTGTFSVKLTLTKNPDILVSGLIGKINIFPSIKKDLPFVPLNALIESNEMTGYIYLLKNNMIEKQKIYVEKIIDSGLVVNKGVSEGDTLITEGLHYITKDSDIKIIH